MKKFLNFEKILILSEVMAPFVSAHSNHDNSVMGNDSQSEHTIGKVLKSRCEKVFEF